MRRRVRRTLIARKVVNLTNTELNVYDWAGNMIKLKPESIQKGTVLPPSVEDVYYVVDSDTPVLSKFNDSKHPVNLAHAFCYGVGRRGENIYKIKTNADTYIIPRR